jgi:hypothetical protein
LKVEITGQNDRQVALLIVLCYSIEFSEKNLNLRQSDVLSFGIVQQMCCSDDESYRWIRFQLKLTNNRDILAI